METQPDRTIQPFQENTHRALHRASQSHGGRSLAAYVFLEAVARQIAKAARWLGRRLVMWPVHALQRRLRQGRTRKALAALDDRMLKDIGIARSEIMWIAAHVCQGQNVCQGQDMRQDQEVRQAGNNRETAISKRHRRPHRASGRRRKRNVEDLFVPVPLQILQPHPCRPGTLMANPHPGGCCETC